MRAGVILNNVVSNVIVVDKLSDYKGPGIIVEAPEGQVEIGFEYRDGHVIKPPDPAPSLDEFKALLSEEIEKYFLLYLRKGFKFREYTISCDPVSQSNGLGFLNAISLGVQVFPIVWRTVENVNIEIEKAEEFIDFAEVMFETIKIKYLEKWEAKDGVAKAKEKEEARLAAKAFIDKCKEA